MKRDDLIKMARLKGYDYDTIKELIVFNKPRTRFATVEKTWRAYITWRYTC